MSVYPVEWPRPSKTRPQPLRFTSSSDRMFVVMVRYPNGASAVYGGNVYRSRASAETRVESMLINPILASMRPRVEELTVR